MPTRLDKAAKAYRAAQAALADIRLQEGAARTTVDQARLELADAIVEEARGGTRQVEIVRRTGYTRERIRQILRAAGIAPD
ncbi:MAG TPA: hypothetical protein VJ849_02310 [Actinomycetes bacterium]|nr:hypothetical protein [Actinomycetes bacterium]